MSVTMGAAVTAVERWRTRGEARADFEASPMAIFWTAVGLATLLGAIPRLLPPLTSDFPLNDGGMFLVMARELRDNGFRLPAFTSYNNAGIPFAYPPLGFYLAAGLNRLTGASLLDIGRLLPPFITLLTIPAFALFANTVARSRTGAIIAVFAFALLPRSFIWLIMGGGLTRAPGALFSILTLWLVYRLYTSNDRRLIAPTAFCGALTVLAHAEWGWFTAYSAGIFFLFLGRNRRAFISSLQIGITIIALTTPWWATVIARHGLAPLLAAAQSGGRVGSGLVSLLAFQITSEPFLPLLAVLGFFGIFAHLANRLFLIPCWLVAILLIQPRSATTLVTLPLALLIATALDRVLLPGLNDLVTARRREQMSAWDSHNRTFPQPPGTPAARFFLAYCLLYSLFSAAAIPYTGSSLRALVPSEREAMGWIASNTPTDSRFLIVTPSSQPTTWWEDKAGEWFPLLATRTSVGTVQGSEWLSGSAFTAQRARFDALQRCSPQSFDCIEEWLQEEKVSITHLVIDLTANDRENSRAELLMKSLVATSKYTQIYSNAEVIILARNAIGDGTHP